MNSKNAEIDINALREELEDLLYNKRREVSNKVRAARELGDLANNPAYDKAFNERKALENRIDEIRELLQEAEV